MISDFLSSADSTVTFVGKSFVYVGMFQCLIFSLGLIRQKKGNSNGEILRLIHFFFRLQNGEDCKAAGVWRFRAKIQGFYSLFLVSSSWPILKFNDRWKEIFREKFWKKFYIKWGRHLPYLSVYGKITVKCTKRRNIMKRTWQKYSDPMFSKYIVHEQNLTL